MELISYPTQLPLRLAGQTAAGLAVELTSVPIGSHDGVLEELEKARALYVAEELFSEESKSSSSSKKSQNSSKKKRKNRYI
jgi:hypothetical protein